MTPIQELYKTEDKIKLANDEFEEALQAYELKDYEKCLAKMTNAHKLFLTTNDTEKISICLSKRSS